MPADELDVLHSVRTLQTALGAPVVDADAVADALATLLDAEVESPRTMAWAVDAALIAGLVALATSTTTPPSVAEAVRTLLTRLAAAVRRAEAALALCCDGAGVKRSTACSPPVL
jgi:hypothetical protein